MAHPTLQTIQERVRLLYQENCAQYSHRTAFEFATEQVFNQLDLPKYDRIVLRCAISKTSDPHYFQKEEGDNTNLERCVRTLYKYGLTNLDEGLTEALRQYRVEYFPDRISFRRRVGKFIGHSGGVRTEALARERKSSSQKTPVPSPAFLLQ